MPTVLLFCWKKLASGREKWYNKKGGADMAEIFANTAKFFRVDAGKQCQKMYVPKWSIVRVEMPVGKHLLLM